MQSSLWIGHFFFIKELKDKRKSKMRIMRKSRNVNKRWRPNTENLGWQGHTIQGQLMKTPWGNISGKTNTHTS